VDETTGPERLLRGAAQVPAATSKDGKFGQSVVRSSGEGRGRVCKQVFSTDIDIDLERGLAHVFEWLHNHLLHRRRKLTSRRFTHFSSHRGYIRIRRSILWLLTSGSCEDDEKEEAVTVERYALPVAA